VASNCPQFIAALDARVPHASQHYSPTDFHRFTAHRGPDGYRLAEDSRDSGVHPDARSAANAAYWRIYDLSLKALASLTAVHAACANWQGSRLLALGRQGAGKTTLMTRLLYEGFAVHCDDVVFLRGRDALPCQRRFRLRPGAIPLLPEIASVVASLPDDGECLLLDPAELGFSWHVEPAPADVIVWLEPGTETAARLERCPRHVMARYVMSQSRPPAGRTRDWIQDTCAVVQGASCWVLYWGELGSTVTVLKQALEDCVKVDAASRRDV
jgi:hypothetical protein